MTINRKLILAGIAGSAGTPSLAWFAPQATALPTDATTALVAAYLDLGIVSEDGLSIDTSVSTEEIEGYGLFSAARVITTKEAKSFKITGRETNPVSLALYERLPLTGAGAPTVTPASGAMAVTSGQSRSQTYVAVFDAVDGANKIRKVCPSVELIDKDSEQISKAANVAYGMTFTAYPDSSGNSVYTYYILDALKTP